MIAYIKGMITEITANSVVLETSGGVAYEIFVMASDLQELPENGEELKLYTYFQVREDGTALYGFLRKSELSLFKQLISVSGIGPKMGHSILSAVGEQELRMAIVTEDAVRLSRAPGVGKKTAERLIIELKDKVSVDEVIDSFSESHSMTGNAGETAEQKKLRESAVSILVALGYKQKEAFAAASQVMITEDMTEEDVMRLALRQMN